MSTTTPPRKASPVRTISRTGSPGKVFTGPANAASSARSKIASTIGTNCVSARRTKVRPENESPNQRIVRLIRHSRESGNPAAPEVALDPRFHEGDDNPGRVRQVLMPDTVMAAAEGSHKVRPDSIARIQGLLANA